MTLTPVTRVRRATALLFTLAVVAFALAVTMRPAEAITGATVTPNTNLTPGQTVTVAWTGGAPGPTGYAVFTICTRQNLVSGEGVKYCSQNFGNAVNNAQGAGSGTLAVSPGQYGTVGESCSATCYIVVTEPGSAAIGVPISFAQATTTSTAPGATTTSTAPGATTSTTSLATTTSTTKAATTTSTAAATSTSTTSTTVAGLARTGRSTLPLTGLGAIAVGLGLVLLGQSELVRIRFGRGKAGPRG